MRQPKYSAVGFVTAAIVLTACSATKYLAPDQRLMDGFTVRIQSSTKIAGSERKKLTGELEDLVRPKPNSRVLGMRFNLWVYNVAGEPKGKGLRYWLRNKVGEPPVLADYPALEKSRVIMENRLENRGYFGDSVQLDTVVRGLKMRAVYTALLSEPYKFRTISFPADSSPLEREISLSSAQSLLKPGDIYDLDQIKKERARIDAWLKKRGYYYFDQNYLLLVADSSVGDRRVDIRVIVKQVTPQRAREVYQIGELETEVGSQLLPDSTSPVMAPVVFDGLKISDPEDKFKPQLFGRVLLFRPGELYDYEKQQVSIKRLISLGVFSFVRANFALTDSTRRILDVTYNLVPSKRKSLSFAATGYTKSDNANGGQVSVTWSNRNIFRSADLLSATIYAGIENQALGGGQYALSNTFGANLNLYLPQILAPFHLPSVASFMPKTKISAGYDYYDRTDQYILNSIKIGFGYIWKQHQNDEHQLTILTVNLVNPSHISPAFQAQLDTDITLARSIERQFIIGPSYNYNYNTLNTANLKTNNFYFNGNLDFSANLIGIISGANVAQGKVKEIFNTPFSQYVRGELDIRHYLRLGKYTMLVSRATGGVGYAYGNSITMPFVKEFFAGGTNDIRAFRSRSVGPGSYYAGNPKTEFVPDQPGDIKMEVNSEFRFKFFSIFRGALFADAGNVWALRPDTSRPGSQFSNQFLQEIAVGVGVGLRADLSILILRLDLGIPVREPYLPAGSRWVFDNKHAVWNFAIGYPF